MGSEPGGFESAMHYLNLAPRSQQTRLVEIVREGLDKANVVFAQAGTGTGKSYVLLSEAMVWSMAEGLPAVVVCPNNTLINQYVEKDAPRIAEALGGKVAYIKGRGRYVCSNSIGMRLDHMGDPAGRKSRFLRLIAGGEYEWAKLGLDEKYGCPGSRKCKPDCSCDARLWRGCDRDLLTGRCLDHDTWHPKCQCDALCGIVFARAKAKDANVVITNVHVLMWDHLIRGWSDGVKGLLPDRCALFVDECHELEGSGRDVLGVEIGPKSKLWDWLPARRWLSAEVDSMIEANETERVLDPEADDLSDLIDLARERMQLLTGEADVDEHDRMSSFVDFLTHSGGYLRTINLDQEDRASVRKTLIDGSSMFAEMLGAQPTVMTSGTIPTSDKRRLGFPKARIEYVGHPFDYSKSRLYISDCDAREKSEVGERIRIAIKAIKAVRSRGGGTLVLFTSWKDVDEVAPRLADGLGNPDDFWVQGREDEYAEAGGSLATDVAEFVASGSGVLCGVKSLFTGLDVPGSALSQVIVWKLPYAVPTAEVKAIQDVFGRSTYRDQMMMTLVQAVGRLIRTRDDRGQVLIMDNRAARLGFEYDAMAQHLAEFTRM